MSIFKWKLVFILSILDILKTSAIDSETSVENNKSFRSKSKFNETDSLLNTSEFTKNELLKISHAKSRENVILRSSVGMLQSNKLRKLKKDQDHSSEASLSISGNRWVEGGNGVITTGSDHFKYESSSIEISRDGNVIAVGFYHARDGSFGGEVNVYTLLNGTYWFPMGSQLLGEDKLDEFGKSLSLSRDGKRLAVGAYLNDGGGTNSGHVRVFEFKEDYKDWIQLGADIDGEADLDYSGSSVSLSGDGNIVAVGAYGNDGASGTRTNSGQTKIYGLFRNVWYQIGKDIVGEYNGDFFGSTVSLSLSGRIVAIGAILHDGKGDASGAVYIYHHTNTDWKMVDKISGEKGGDLFGSSISISSNGLRLAVGSYHHDGEDRSGPVKVYEYNRQRRKYLRLGSEVFVSGDTYGVFSNTKISISGNGNMIAFGSGISEGGHGNNRGTVFTFLYQEGEWKQIGINIDEGSALAERTGVTVALSETGERLIVGSFSSRQKTFQVFSLEHHDYFDSVSEKSPLKPTKHTKPVKQPISPTKMPMKQPTLPPFSAKPSIHQLLSPSIVPTTSPTKAENPSAAPTPSPTKMPTKQPTIKNPTNKPSTIPTVDPTKQPTLNPTKNPTRPPTKDPTRAPTKQPTTANPTNKPTKNPTTYPTRQATSNPTKKPTRPPTKYPTRKPTKNPTRKPTSNLTKKATNQPTVLLSTWPSLLKSENQTFEMTLAQTMSQCADDVHYRDIEVDIGCDSINGVVCHMLGFVGLSQEGVKGVMQHCPKSCGYCKQREIHPTVSPTETPSELTLNPTKFHTTQPTTNPTIGPTNIPTKRLTLSPSAFPSTFSPSAFPSNAATPACVDDPTYENFIGMGCRFYSGSNCMILDRIGLSW
eukprot:CAMPEP_0194271966 /NCGR_PEP_ID=MMETSP0169-20130528/5649_1 /TAXON_ID=218684 /ORGANISM="Corethron pennatum, Strain L29A3" /LENGTH=872 /DNA_ID=CAMNT_0039014491 /DNA_START=138 /DNA_END=2753 /DNA_ORIENTATION=+